MAFNSGYRMRKKHYTPPPTLFSNDKVLESIIRLLVFLARASKSATFFSGGEPVVATDGASDYPGVLRIAVVFEMA